jgi:hypothetical protein
MEPNKTGSSQHHFKSFFAQVTIVKIQLGLILNEQFFSIGGNMPPVKISVSAESNGDLGNMLIKISQPARTISILPVNV